MKSCRHLTSLSYKSTIQCPVNCYVCCNTHARCVEHHTDDNSNRSKQRLTNVTNWQLPDSNTGDILSKRHEHVVSTRLETHTGNANESTNNSYTAQLGKKCVVLKRWRIRAFYSALHKLINHISSRNSFRHSRSQALFSPSVRNTVIYNAFHLQFQACNGFRRTRITESPRRNIFEI